MDRGGELPERVARDDFSQVTGTPGTAGDVAESLGRGRGSTDGLTVDKQRVDR